MLAQQICQLAAPSTIIREGFAASFEMLAELDPSGASTSDRKCECASM